MERYKEYKDSGVKWLGEIPSHWKTPRLNQIGNYINGYAFKPKHWSDSGKPIIRIQDLTGSNNNPNFFNGTIPDKYLIKRGDVLVSWAATLDAFVWDKEDGWLNQHIFKAIPYEGINRHFYLWLLKIAMENLNNDNKHGIMMEHLTAVVFNHFRVPLPPLEEQIAIASYLDSVTSKIDRAIAQLQRMIELLNERKQIIINNAVTKGLDPNVPMKDSGVEWIGMIPEHWEVRKLGTIGSTINGVSHDSNFFGEGDPFVSYSDVYKNYSLPKFVPGLAKSSNQEKRVFSVERGDVFFTRTSETAEEIGFTSTCLETIPDAVFAGFLIRFRPNANLLVPDFSKYFFRAHIHRSYFVKEMNLVIRASLSQQLLKGLPILLPSLQEQSVIANYLDSKVNEIDLCLRNKINQISLLQERKQIIINDVVTGKVKVV